MSNYVCFYNGKRLEVQADTLFQAKEKAVAEFKAPKSKRHMVSVLLADVEHSTCEL